MAQPEEVKDLSGAGVAPPLRLYLFPSPSVHVMRARANRQAAAPSLECEHDSAFDAGRSSPIGNPFADNVQQHENVAHAYDDWLALIAWLGSRGQARGASGMTALIAQRHGVRLRDAARNPDIQAAWAWLHRAACGQGTVYLTGSQGETGPGRAGYSLSLSSVAGAISWLRCAMQRGEKLAEGVGAKAGDWPVADIYTRWPVAIATELSTFHWPITSESELRALIACPHASPSALVACEFTAAVRSAYEHHWRFGRVALSVDVRTSLVPGPHARLDVRMAIGAKRWGDAFLHPPCTHQVCSDSAALRSKQLDGRTFWGVAFFIYCLCVDAHRVMVEQPATVIPDVYTHPTQRLRPCDVGDDDNKPVHLYERGGRTLIPKSIGADGASGHKRLRDFSGADERDRWRSSWARFPRLSAAVVAAVDEAAPPAEPLDYPREIEAFAVSWYEAGLPVPVDYAAPDAQPTLETDRAYQSQRGRGDGRRVQGVIPTSRRAGSNAWLLPTDGQLHHATPTWHTALCLISLQAHRRLCSNICASLRQGHTSPHSLALCGGPARFPRYTGRDVGGTWKGGHLHLRQGMSAQPALPPTCTHEGAPQPGTARPVLRPRVCGRLSTHTQPAAGSTTQPAPQRSTHACLHHAGPPAHDVEAAETIALPHDGAAVLLVVVAMQMIPLAWAHTSGIRILGADLNLSASHRYSLVRRWAEAIVQGAAATTFLAGRADATYVYVAPLALAPRENIVARSVAVRRRLVRAGVAFAWLTVAALVDTPIHSAVGHAVAMCTSLRGEDGAIPNAVLPGGGGSFRVGVTGVSSLVNAPEGIQHFQTSLERISARIIYDNAVLTSALLDDTSEFAADMKDWAAQIGVPPLSEIPSGLLESVPSLVDSRLDRLAFPSTPTPPTLEWPPRMPLQRAPPSGACPRCARDLMPEATWRKVERWLRRTLEDLICIRDEGDGCERRRPGVLVIGQGDLYPWARGIVWDFRNVSGSCAIPLNYHASLKHTLNVEFFKRRLRDYPNQQILGFIAEGMRPWADVELQTVLVPHLMSLAKGFPSVVKEIKRMSAPDLQWYSTHADFPFWPMYSLGEGCVPRKLECRWRRCEEGGGPRKETYDSEGIRAWSLNEASRAHHFPRHYADDTRAEWARYLQTRRLPASAEQHAEVIANRGTKWHRQQMPRLAHAMKALLVLKRAAFLMQEPVYLFGDDVKDYFNHLVHASEVLHLMNTVFLDAGDLTEQAVHTHAKGSLIFVHEKRMGFGLHPNSVIAQDLSEALNAMLREDIDRVEDPILEADPRPSVQAWLSERRALEADVGGHQRRLYFALMYCDDNIIGVVGAARAVRVLKQWRTLTQSAGLIMAIPEKRSLGVWCKWIGALIFAVVGLIVIPKDKIVRASSAIRTLLSEGIEFAEYRALMGLLEHVRDVARLPRRFTHGLYAPHGAGGEGADGPNAIVRPKVFMSIQFTKWLDVLSRCGGCAITDVLRRSDIAALPVARFLAASDAATDSDPPGLGGYMHGAYWNLPIPLEDTRWLHITVLELLACAFNAIIFTRLLPSHARLTLLVDATSAYHALANETERSSVLIRAHHTLLSEERFRVAAKLCDIVHGSGDCNIAGDAASRSRWDVLQAFAAALRIRTRRVEVPSVCHALYQRVLKQAVAAGVVVRPGFKPPERPLPTAAQTLLGRIELLAARHPPVVGPSSSGFISQEVIEHAPRGLITALREAGVRGTGRDKAKSAPTTSGLLAALRQPSGQVGVRAPTHAGVNKSSVGLIGKVQQPSAMATTLIQGVQLAALTCPRTPSRDPRRAQREADSLRAAARRADDMASPHATDEQRQRLAAGLAHSLSLAQFGAAEKTLQKDDCAWAQWRAFSDVYGFDPVVPRVQAVQQPDLLSTRLGLFLLWVYPRVRGRGRADAHPRSVLTSYPGAIARILRRDHKLPTPRASTYEAEAKGLLRGYKRVYGTLALAPRRRQPMTRSLWNRIEALQPGHQLVGRSPWMSSNRHLDMLGLRLGRVLSATAHRLGEIVAYSSEISYLTRENVTYRIRGVVYVDPSQECLRQMQAGDIVYLSPCSSKPDQFGEEHCTFPSVLSYDGSSRCAAGAIRDIELEAPCRGSARRFTPLFADIDGSPYSYFALNDWLNKLLTALIGAQAAAAFSWHSFRIELACLLRAAGCPDSLIQLICRWKCPESVQKYAQVGSADNVEWLRRAHAVHFDAVRTNNMVALDNSEAYAHLDEHAWRRAPASAHVGPAVRDRVEVEWGAEWFAGVVTSRRQGHSSTGDPATIHRVLYEATALHRAHASWHDFAEVHWRLAPVHH